MTQSSSTLPSFAMRAPPPPTAHEGSIHLSYNSANYSALQATTARDAYGRVVISYQRYEYNDDLSERLPVINNTTNLSEGLPIINDTSAKITCMVVLSINALMTYVAYDLCGRWLMWSMTCDLYGQ